MESGPGSKLYSVAWNTSQDAYPIEALMLGRGAYRRVNEIKPSALSAEKKASKEPPKYSNVIQFAMIHTGHIETRNEDPAAVAHVASVFLPQRRSVTSIAACRVRICGEPSQRI